MYTVLPRILCVDDEPKVLDGLARNLRRSFDVTTATSGDQALDILQREGSFAVVVSDQRMPVMDGVSFLSRVREIAPDTVRILLTGYADTAAAIAAVNRGAVFRFLTKPIENGELTQVLHVAVEQHRLVTAEKVLLERTLHGSITAIVDTLALMNPAAFGRAGRVKAIAAELAAAVRAPDTWQIEIAAMLSQVGQVAQPTAPPAAPAPMAPYGAGVYGRPSITPVARNGSTGVERATLGRLSRIGADMVASIPRMEEVHAMLTHHDLRYDAANGHPGDPREQGIPLGARILKVAFDLEELESQGSARADALDAMKGRWGCYDPHLLEALAPAAATPMLMPSTPQPEVARSKDIDIEIRKLEPGMTVREDVRTKAGRVLIARGEVASVAHVQRIKTTLDFNELRQLLRITPAGEGEGSESPLRRVGGMF